MSPFFNHPEFIHTAMEDRARRIRSQSRPRRDTRRNPDDRRWG